jgi:hypothetical protein
MSKPFRDEAEIYTYIINAKSQILSLCSTVENLLEITLASHFSILEKDYELFCNMFYPNEIGLTFGIKTKLFKKLLEQDEPRYLVKNPDFINSIDRVRKLRNSFAHSMNQPKSNLKKFIGKKHFELDYLELGKMTSKPFTIDDVKKRYDELKKIILELQQFNLRDEKRKAMKIIKKTTNP